MRPLHQRKELIKYLGQLFRGVSSDGKGEFRQHAISLENKIPEIIQSNQWFTRESIYRVIKIWGDTLEEKEIEAWESIYNDHLNSTHSKKVMVIMAGNIPLVGFHDFLSTIITGHHFMGKLSSRDNILFPLIKDWIIDFDPGWEEYIQLSTKPFPDIDALIATGSNNTAKFIERRYSGKPKIIRHNRNSLAILSGEESEQELERLSQDILWYYGLGCRNTSLLFIPEDYELNNFIKILEEFNTELPKPYINNLRYQRSKALMHKIDIVDAGKILLIPNPGLNSPLACLYIRRYSNPDEIHSFRNENQDNIQCVVGKPEIWTDALDFGMSQLPGLKDYADGIDTIDFLLGLK